MHVRVGFEQSYRRLAGVKRPVARPKLRFDCLTQFEGALLEIAPRIERACRGGIPQQCKRLIVEERPIVQWRSIDAGQGPKQAVASTIIRREIIGSAEHDTAYVARPAQAGRLRECVDLSRVNSGATRMRQADST